MLMSLFSYFILLLRCFACFLSYASLYFAFLIFFNSSFFSHFSCFFYNFTLLLLYFLIMALFRFILLLVFSFASLPFPSFLNSSIFFHVIHSIFSLHCFSCIFFPFPFILLTSLHCPSCFFPFSSFSWLSFPLSVLSCSFRRNVVAAASHDFLCLCIFMARASGIEKARGSAAVPTLYSLSLYACLSPSCLTSPLFAQFPDSRFLALSSVSQSLLSYLQFTISISSPLLLPIPLPLLFALPSPFFPPHVLGKRRSRSQRRKMSTRRRRWRKTLKKRFTRKWDRREVWNGRRKDEREGEKVEKGKRGSRRRGASGVKGGARGEGECVKGRGSF